MQAYGKWAVKHNDAYVDSPTLEIGHDRGNTNRIPRHHHRRLLMRQNAEVPPTPQYTPTPRPDGAIVHTVVSGDTLFGIALAYDIPVDDIYELNNLDSSFTSANWARDRHRDIRRCASDSHTRSLRQLQKAHRKWNPHPQQVRNQQEILCTSGRQSIPLHPGFL